MHKYAVYLWIEFQTLLSTLIAARGNDSNISKPERKESQEWLDISKQNKKWALEFMTYKSNL